MQDRLEASLYIIGRGALIFLLESSLKNIKNDATFFFFFPFPLQDPTLSLLEPIGKSNFSHHKQGCFLANNMMVPVPSASTFSFSFTKWITNLNVFCGEQLTTESHQFSKIIKCINLRFSYAYIAYWCNFWSLSEKKEQAKRRVFLSKPLWPWYLYFTF